MVTIRPNTESNEPLHPGVMLSKRYLEPLGLTPTQLAKSIGVPARQVSELLEGRRPLTPDMAARLGLFFDAPPEWWLVHQARYDAAQAVSTEALRDLVTPYEGLADVLVTPHGVTRLPAAEAPSATSSTATFSPQFLTRLRAQVESTEARVRHVSERTLADGTVALLGD